MFSSYQARTLHRFSIDSSVHLKKMSLPALVPVTNWNSHGLKLILLFCNYDILLYLAAALIRLCHQSYKAFSDLNIRIIQSILPIMPVVTFNRQVPALIKHRQRIFCIRSVIDKILRLIWPAGQLLHIHMMPFQQLHQICWRS